MNRTALRLMARATLLNGGTAPFPTFALGNVMDSESSDLPFQKDGDKLAYIVVSTGIDEEGEITPSGDVQHRAVELQLEMGLSTAARVDGALVAGWPRSDANLEAFLDLFELQVEAAFFSGAVWPMFFRQRFQIGRKVSEPIWVDESGTRVKVAARRIMLTVDGIPADDLPPALYDTKDTLGEYVQSYVPGIGKMLTDVFALIDSKGAGDLKTTAAQLKAMLEGKTFPDAGRYPPLVSVHSILVPADATSPPTSETETPYVVAELLER